MNDHRNVDNFLTQLYHAARKKQLGEIQRLIRELPPSSDLDSTLNEINTETWQHIVSTEKKRRRQQLIWQSTLGFSLVIILALVVFWNLRDIISPPAEDPTATMIPTSTLNLPESDTPTATLLPPTTTPTMLPPTHTPTLTPTAIPNSSFLVDPLNIYPAVPVLAEMVWILNEDRSDFVKSVPPLEEGDFWQSAASTYEYEQDGEQKTLDEQYLFTTTGENSITWQMDQPFRESGLYQIFFLDTLENSTYIETLTFDIEISPSNPELGEGISVEPAYGVRSVLLNTDDLQEQNTWISLGYYEISEGDWLKVGTQISELGEGSSFAVDRLMIVKVVENSAHFENLYEWPIVLFVDDADTTEFLDLNFNSITRDWLKIEEREDSLTWNNTYLTLVEENRSGKGTIKVVWLPSSRIPMGKYELWVHIPPENSTVEATYRLRLNGENELQEPDSGSSSGIIEQESIVGWINVGAWTIDADSTVEIVMEIPQTVPGSIGIDAVALLDGEGIIP